ncbi:hypothetical protein CGJ90_21700, partial [Vibrio parahaemolyticus]
QTLVETYEKRDDKSEINSLIRLMELTTPAQLSQVTLSAEDRTAVQISELSAAMHNMQATQSKILTSLNKAVSFEKESAAIHPTNSLAGLKRAWEESDKRRYKLSFESPE